MIEWTQKTILERAAGMRKAAEIEKEKADLRIQFAILLEEIARAWPENSGHWIRWGQYFKCSRCGHLSEEQTDTCPECKAEMERVK